MGKRCATRGESTLLMYGIIVCTIVLLLLYVALMAVYAVGWRRLSPLPSPDDAKWSTKVSVLIPARNEAANIRSCLSAILHNNYPKDLLEIIVIDDYSTDDTADIARQLLPQGIGKVLSLKDYLTGEERLNAYKKKALETAIAQAVGTLILTTDADCICPPGWIGEIVALYEQSQAKFMVAPVDFTPAGKKGLLYYFQSLDFMTMQGITAAGTQLNIGSMCNGANLAFERAAFDAVGGYQGIDHIASGDDMLLLYKIKQRFPYGIRYLKRQQAVVHTPCQPTFKAFLQQRIRWASKSAKYDDRLLKAVLLVVYLFNLGLFILFLVSFSDTRGFLVLLGLLAMKTTAELLFLAPVATFYGKRKELLLFPLLQPLHVFYIVATGFLGLFGKYHWKGRRVQ